MFAVQVDESVRLAMPTDELAGPVFDLIDAERDRFARWLPALPASVEEQAASFRSRRESIAAGTHYSFVVLVNGEPAGTIGMGPLVDATAEFGYLLASRFEGRGIVTRSLATLIDEAVAELAVHRFEIYCDPRNEQSRAVARRLGFRREGLLREAIKVAEGFVDQELYGLLASDWTAARTGNLRPPRRHSH